MASTNPARGMRDFLPVDVRKRNYVIGIIKEVYESYGFEPLETPAVENIETLLGKYGEEGNQLVFKILKRGAKLAEVAELQSDRVGEDSNSESPQLRNSENSLTDLALRYDLTVPLARVVANNKNDLPKFFKRYQIQPVWRADRPARGRFREFYQCDVDAIGSESMVVEAELITAVCSILIKLGFDDFTVRVNHREVLRGILEACKVHPNYEVGVLTAIDKLDKIGTNGVISEFAVLHLHPETEELLRNFLMNLDRINEDRSLKSLEAFVQNSERAMAGFADLKKLINFSANRNLRIDISLARGLSYYTGTIMEINVPDLAGSLGGGGRYDGLIGMFGKEQIPACGFSLGLERILVVMEERGMFPPEIADSTPADVMVTIWNDDTVADSLALASELREQGLRVTLYPDADKLGKQFKYADSIKVPFVCVLGDTEIAEGKVTVKNLTSGEQQVVERDSVAKFIKEGENSH